MPERHGRLYGHVVRLLAEDFRERSCRDPVSRTIRVASPYSVVASREGLQSNPVITNPMGNGISFFITGFRYTRVLDIFESMKLLSAKEFDV